jgi:hypothetical protein
MTLFIGRPAMHTHAAGQRPEEGVASKQTLRFQSSRTHPWIDPPRWVVLVSLLSSEGFSAARSDEPPLSSSSSSLPPSLWSIRHQHHQAPRPPWKHVHKYARFDRSGFQLARTTTPSASFEILATTVSEGCFNQKLIFNPDHIGCLIPNKEIKYKLTIKLTV